MAKKSNLVLTISRLAFLAVIILITTVSVREYWLEFLNLNPNTSEAALIAQQNEAKDLSLYLTNDAYYPTIVYYSDLNQEISVIKPYQFAPICEFAEQPFRFLTEQGFLQKTTGYQKIAQQGEYILVEYDQHECGPKEWIEN